MMNQCFADHESGGKTNSSSDCVVSQTVSAKPSTIIPALRIEDAGSGQNSNSGDRKKLIGKGDSQTVSVKPSTIIPAPRIEKAASGQNSSSGQKQTVSAKPSTIISAPRIEKAASGPDATKVEKPQLKNGNDESKEMIDRQFKNIGNSSSGKNGRKKGRSRRAPAKTEKTLPAPQSKIAGSDQNSSSANRKKQGRKGGSQTDSANPSNIIPAPRIEKDKVDIEQPRRMKKTGTEDIQDEDVREEVLTQKTVETRVLKSNDSSDNERIQYDREFLLEFQYAQMSRPAYLKNVDCVVYEIHAPIESFIPFQRICNRHNSIRQSAGGTKSIIGQKQSVSAKPSTIIPAPRIEKEASGVGTPDATKAFEKLRDKEESSCARNKQKKRNRKGGSKTTPVDPQKVIHAPQFEKVETVWVRPSILVMGMTEEEKSLFEIQRAVCSILNKLTPQKFELLVNQMMALEIDNSAKLETVVNSIFERAIYEREFIVIYANMCRVLTNQFMHVPLSGRKTVSFEKLLLDRCKFELKKVVMDEKQCVADRNKIFGTLEERKNHLAELDHREMQNRRRMLGSIRFIDELYKLKMISEHIMHVCIRKLFKAGKDELFEDPLKCLAKLLTNIGNNFEKPNHKRRMDLYFKQIGKIIENRKVSSRIRFVLKDVLELRSETWASNLDEKESCGGHNKRKKRNRKGSSQTATAPQFEKVETEWVRPSTFAKAMSGDEETIFEIVCSILNRLTP